MSVAIVDTSCLLAIAFDEPGSSEVQRQLESVDMLLASNLLEAEYRAALMREEIPFDGDVLTWLRWILPDRPLGPEVGRVLEAGRLRGADLWHLACGLYVSPVAADLTVLTLDHHQRDVAEALGFRTA